MNATITRQDVEQAAKDACLDVLEAISRMQMVASRAGDEKLLDRLCEIKAEVIEAYLA
jgi:hypothetical protein